jgi:hypothetical protein
VENATGYSWLIDPENAGWISGNDTLATVQWNTEFMGNAEISVKSLNDCGESNFSESLTVTVDNTVGLGQYGEGNFLINIIPNPSGGIFRLEIHASRPAEIELSIINGVGAILYHSDWLNVDKMMVKEFDLSEYPEGLYYLKIMDSKSSVMRKLVITK